MNSETRNPTIANGWSGIGVSGPCRVTNPFPSKKESTIVPQSVLNLMALTVSDGKYWATSAGAVIVIRMPAVSVTNEADIPMNGPRKAKSN
jgi:hypothetical protein